jgi:hypothetical protein
MDEIAEKIGGKDSVKKVDEETVKLLEGKTDDEKRAI